MKKVVFAALVICLSFVASAYADPYPEALIKKMAALKEDAEAKKDMPAAIEGLPIVTSEEANKLFKEEGRLPG